MMILSEKSYMRNPPEILNPIQVTIFNAIRFSLDICEISYKRLLENLNKLTDKRDISGKDFPEIFLDVWSIINNCVIFYKVISREFKLENEEPFFQEILKAKYLRDSNQHIDERLTQIFKNKDYPVYGSLSWRKMYMENNTFKISTIYSGLFTHKNNVAMSISNNVESELNRVIQQIEFTGIARKGTKPDFYFEEQKVSITRIILDLQWWTNRFDNQIEQQLEGFDISNRHIGDLLIQLIGKRE